MTSSGVLHNGQPRVHLISQVNLSSERILSRGLNSFEQYKYLGRPQSLTNIVMV